jgi:hypothetical protein
MIVILLIEVQKYLLSNVIDEKAFIMGYKNILESGEVSLDLKLLSGDFTLLSDEEFIDANEIAYSKLGNGEYPCSMYLHIFNRYYQFVELGALIIELKDLEMDIHDGLKIAAENCNEKIDIKFMAMGHEGFLETEYGKNLIRLYEEINQQIDDKKMKTIESEIIEAIKMSDNFHLNVIFEHNFSKPMFKYIDADKLFNAIISLDNKRLANLIQAIKKRYINITEEVLIDDAKSLMQLSTKIRGHIENKEVSFSVSFLNYLSKSIDNALKKIDSSQVT